MYTSQTYIQLNTIKILANIKHSPEKLPMHCGWHQTDDKTHRPI